MVTQKFNELDIRKLYLASKFTQCILAGLCIFAVLTLGYIGLFRSQLETLSQSKNQEVELKKAYTQKSIEVANLNHLQAELSSIHTAVDILLQQLPTDAEMPIFIQELHQAAAASGLHLDNVLPQPHVNEASIQKLPYEITLTGQFDQLHQFTRNIGERPFIITLESLSIQHPAATTNPENNSDLLTLNATASTYKIRPTAELQQEIAETKQTDNDEQADNSNQESLGDTP